MRKSSADEPFRVGPYLSNVFSRVAVFGVDCLRSHEKITDLSGTKGIMGFKATINQSQVQYCDATNRGKTPKQWVANHERMKHPPACEHGHLECSCSSTAGGPCLNEMLALIGE